MHSRLRCSLMLAVLMSCAAPSLSVAQTSSDRPVGHWQGFMLSDGDTVEVVIDIDRLPYGGLVGEMDLPLQDLVDYPLGVEVADGELLLSLGFNEIEAGGGGFRAGYEPGLAVLRGHFEQGDSKLPFLMEWRGAPQISSALRTLLDDAPDSLVVEALSADASELRDRFNQDSDYVRLIMLMAPS